MVYCVISLELPRGGDSNEDTQHTITSIKKTITRIIPNKIMSEAMGLFLLGTQERVRNSRGERAISVRATEVLPYYGAH